MNSGFLFTALAVISALTSLTVEALKKIFNEKGIKYSSNLLAAIVSVVLTIAICVGGVLYSGVPFTIQEVIIMIAMTFLSFLSSTVGFDKVKQLLEQLGA